MGSSRHSARPTGGPSRRGPGTSQPFRPAGMLPTLSRDRAPASHTRRRALRLLAALALAPAAARSRADTIPVVSARLETEEDDLVLSAEFDFELTPALEQALEKGIPLYFVIEFELLRKRPLWFPEKVAQWSITYRVSYSSLTRQYRVSSGPLGQTFESLADVQRFLGHVSSRPVARIDDLVKGARYEAAVRERLDVNQLPKPFQVNALASREWQLSSDWHRFEFTP
jgi:hypothetical protein